MFSSSRSSSPYLAFAWIALAALLGATLSHSIAIRGAVPSFVVIVLAMYAVRSGIAGAIALGAVGGLIEDALGATGGAWTLSTATCGLVIALCARAIFADSAALLAAIVIAATLLRELLFWGVMSVQGESSGALAGHYTKSAVLAAAYTGAVWVVFSWARWRFARDRAR